MPADAGGMEALRGGMQGALESCGCLCCRAEEALSAPELSAVGGCGANSINVLHSGKVGLIQREMLQEVVRGVFSSALG